MPCSWPTPAGIEPIPGEPGQLVAFVAVVLIAVVLAGVLLDRAVLLVAVAPLVRVGLVLLAACCWPAWYSIARCSSAWWLFVRVELLIGRG